MKQEIVDFYDNYLDSLKVENNRHRWVKNSIDKYIPRFSKVLDVGCGTGITSRYLAKNDRDVVAIDVSPKLIEYAKSMNSHFGKVEYLVGDISTFTGYGNFDAILLVDVLEHILAESLPNTFDVLKKVSNKSTKIYLNIPSFEILTWLWENKPDNRQIVDNPIETGEILRMFSEIGFVPWYMQLYWGHYQEYLFITKDQYNDVIKGAF